MALPTFNKATFNAVALGTALATMPFAAANANDSCGNCHTPGAYETSHAQAGVESRHYAQENNAIGIMIHYGAFEGAPSAEAIGEKFVEELAKRGEQAKYFIVQADKPGISMMFNFPFTGTDPMSVPDAARKLDDIVVQKQRIENYVAAAPSADTN